MNNLPPEQIKDIAEQLDCGFRAFIHKTSYQMLFVPNENDLIDIELDPWEEEFTELDNNFTDYFEVEKWSSNEAFQMMEDFTEQLSTNSKLQSELFKALNKRKPFREFKFVIDNSGDFREQWFDFKNRWQLEFVKRQISR